MKIVTRLFNKPDNESFFLFGARGTGKSTWCMNSFKEPALVDLLAPDVLRVYLARPEMLKEFVLGQKANTTVIIDEVQKAPELLTVVHLLMEEKLPYTFVLTGSSSRKLKHSGVDLLAGRALVRNMHPFMARELGALFNLDTVLQQGMLPVVWDSSAPQDVLKSYVGIYLQEEVMREGLVRHLEGFARFLEAVSFSHGQVLNISNVARECSVKRKTVEGFVSILEDLLLASRVAVFRKKAKRATVTHPKLYFFDTGVFRNLRPKGPLDRPEEINGAALEGLVYQHLRTWIDYSNTDLKLYYWRTRAGSEVDFIVYGEAGFWAIEIKNTSVVRNSDLRALKTFRDDYPQCTPLLLYRGDSRLYVNDIICCPVEEFLMNLYPGEPDLTGTS